MTDPSIYEKSFVDLDLTSIFFDCVASISCTHHYPRCCSQTDLVHFVVNLPYSQEEMMVKFIQSKLKKKKNLKKKQVKKLCDS